MSHLNTSTDQPGVPRRCSVLVLDGEENERQRIASYLRERGLDVAVAATADEALGGLAGEPADVMLVDLEAPGAGSAEFIQRARTVCTDLDTIVLARRPSAETAIAALRAGASEFLAKPVDLVELASRMTAQIERRRERFSATLHDVGCFIFDARDRERLPERIVDLAAKSLSADAGSLLLPGGSDDLVLVYSTVKAGPAASPQGRHAIAERVARGREPVLLRGPASDDPRFADISGSSRPHSSIVYPLCSADRCLGVLTLNRKAPPSFSAGDVDRAGLLASEIVLALENTRALRAVVGAEKLATIGQVAASIVHEINNPLACVLANVEAAQTRVTRILEHPGWYEADAPAAPQALAEVQQMLAEARDAGVRIKEIIRDMRSLTSGDAAATIFDVGEAVGSAVRIAGGSLRMRATLDIEPGRGLKTVGSASQLSQVLLNLLINAGDALAETPRRDPRISVRAWRDDKSVLIAIADNGPGMSPGVAARAFEPFFTTKARSGTGLGLSISRDIVRRYGGEIRLNTNPGVGSEFVVVLPSAEVTARE